MQGKIGSVQVGVFLLGSCCLAHPYFESYILLSLQVSLFTLLTAYLLPLLYISHFKSLFPLRFSFQTGPFSFPALSFAFLLIFFKVKSVFFISYCCWPWNNGGDDIQGESGAPAPQEMEGEGDQSRENQSVDWAKQEKSLCCLLPLQKRPARAPSFHGGPSFLFRRSLSPR